MADIILMRCDCDYTKNLIYVSCVNGSAGTPFPQLYSRAVDALAYLMEVGFSIRYESADPSGFNYTLIRETIPPVNPIIELLESLVNTVVSIETDAGTVSGLLLLVGTDVIELREASGDIVLIPIASINAVQ
jgi:hypothetical protein